MRVKVLHGGLYRLFVCILLTSSFCTHTSAQPAKSQPLLLADSLKNDLSVLYQLLTRLHPGSTIHCSAENLQRCYDSLQNTITNKTDITRFYEKTAVLCAKIKDGHTGVGKDQVRKIIFQKKLIPFSLYLIDTDIYISRTGQKELDSLIGKKLVSVNGVSSQVLLKKISQACGVEGNNPTGINAFLQDFPFHYYLLDTASIFTVVMADTSGRKITLTIPGVAYKAFKLRTVKLVDPIKQDFTENQIAILTLNTFSIEDLTYKSIDYKKYLDNFFSQVKDKEIQKLIIDVRGNGGGSPEVASYLFSHLTDTTYYYFDLIGRKNKNPEEFKPYCLTPEKLTSVDTVKCPRRDSLYTETETPAKDFWWFELQKGKKKHYQGAVYVLADGGSFSTTGHFIGLIKQYNRGALYGECSQGSIYSNDAELQFKLPYSGLEVRIPTGHFKMRLPGFPYDPKGICPDTEITKQPYDLKTGYDRQLNEVINRISQ